MPSAGARSSTRTGHGPTCLRRATPTGSRPWGTGRRPHPPPPPAMAFRGGRLFMPFGTPGGDVQQQAMLQVFLNIAVFGMRPQEAVEAPRIATRSFPDSFWPHPSAPGVLEVERRIAPETRAALAGLGHVVSEWPDLEWWGG